MELRSFRLRFTQSKRFNPREVSMRGRPFGFLASIGGMVLTVAFSACDSADRILMPTNPSFIEYSYIDTTHRWIYNVTDVVLGEGEVPGSRQTVGTCMTGPQSGTTPNESYTISFTAGGTAGGFTFSVGISATRAVTPWNWSIAAGEKKTVTFWKVDQSRQYTVVFSLQELVNGDWQFVSGAAGQDIQIYHTYLFRGSVIDCHDQGGGG